jgi:hypothetical protein
MSSEHREHEEAGERHRRERHAPAEERRETEAHDRRRCVADVAADAVRRVCVAEPARRDARVQDREVGGVEHAVAEAHQDDDREQPAHAGHERSEERAAGEQREAGEERGPRAEAVDEEPRGELRDARRRVERAHQRAEQRPRHVELRAQQREQRRQRELKEVRGAVRHADEPDHAGIAQERLRGGSVQDRRDVR